MDWQSCERYKHELKDGKKGSPCFDCGIEAKGYEPKTNADAIRNMTDEELAEFLSEYEVCTECEYNDHRSCTLNNTCVKGFAQAMAMKWLQAEVKEGNSNENT